MQCIYKRRGIPENVSEGLLRRTGGAYTLFSTTGMAVDRLMQKSPDVFEGSMYLASTDREKGIKDVIKEGVKANQIAILPISKRTQVPPPPAGSLIFTKRAYIEPSYLRFFKDYQIEGVRFMFERLRSANGALLADEMGLGKTFQAVAVMRIFCQAGGLVLVVSPCSLVGVWEKEIKKWAEKLRVFNGALKHPNKYKRLENVLLISYEKLASVDMAQHNFQLVICDEAHRLRTSTSQALQALKKMASKKLLLTGTPFQNTVQEYKTLLALIDERAARAKGIKELSGIASDAVLRRKIERTSLCLPQKDEMIWIIENKEYEEYCSVYWSAQNKVGIEDIQRLRMHAGTSASKWDVFLKLSKEILMERESLVIVSRYIEVIRKATEAIKSMANNREVPITARDVTDFHGEMNIVKREEALSLFQSKGQKVIILSAKCGAEGLTLVKSTRMIIIDSDWNPANDLQAMARVWRLGQTKPVVIHRLFLMGTIEEYILLVQMKKIEIQKQLEGLLPPEEIEEQLSQYEEKGTFQPQRTSIVHKWLRCACSEDYPLAVSTGYSHTHTDIGLILSQRINSADTVQQRAN
ncbi:DNA repair and recombination protein RAD54B [Nematocida minor]|uniref:DNA repair and recombination protein RAD54B n=1 Tax=Nematocida minor TaxID=1912983 RepID=UPI00221FC11D|nr:DNA repair and recombination protein RAD54B [Nematocida minor]XP_051332042.1 DNA repair and recombination protein RAD54B [Nematocida minor]KAI5188772.1 DNA repair and recombination protein RAD54B [Nematocida minor]KAI5188876.1 DNA repair and recombination protein RAD54B [Nematocida minor]